MTDIDEIAARAAKATPGPWAHDYGVVTSGNGPSVAVAYTGEEWRHGEGLRPFPEAAGNGEFIAHAREDIPALIAEIARLREAGRAFYNAVAAVSDAALRTKEEPAQEMLDRLTETARIFNAALAPPVATTQGRTAMVDPSDLKRVTQAVNHLLNYWSEPACEQIARVAIEAYEAAKPKAGCMSSGDHDWTMTITRGPASETICRTCYAAGIIVIHPAAPEPTP